MTIDQQHQFFRTFGYLVLPGFLDGERLASEFDAVFVNRGVKHEESYTRAEAQVIIPFIDQSPWLLESLLDNPQLVSLLEKLLGADYGYFSSDGRHYVGDTGWHADAGLEETHSLKLKVAAYVDPVTAETGALRVIPGSHLGDRENWKVLQPASRCEELTGTAGRDVPSVALESQPGDLVIFDHRLLHAAYGGSNRRRMFAMTFIEHLTTEAQFDELRESIRLHISWGLDQAHADSTWANGSAERRRHLEQVASVYRDVVAETEVGTDSSIRSFTHV